jgi:hypothetical protein
MFFEDIVQKPSGRSACLSCTKHNEILELENALCESYASIYWCTHW